MSIQTAGDVCSRRLPPAVRGIQTRFVQAKALWELPLRSLRMVHVIISFTPLAPFNGTITFSRQKAADILGVSTRSVSRYLNDLVDAGLIERLPQYQKNGVWDCTTVRWTRLAWENYFSEVFSNTQKGMQKDHEVKILESNNSFDTMTGNSPDRETEKSHKTKTYKNKEENKTTRAIFHKKTDLTPEEKHLRQQMPGTPFDLIKPALSLGLNRIHVATLMKNCKQTSQRLQDLFTLYLEKLLERKIIGKAALAWLLAVIRRRQDTGWMVTQKNRESQQTHKQSKNRQLVEKVSRQLEQVPVNLPDGAVVTDVYSGMAYLRQKNGITSSCPLARLSENLVRHHPFWTVRLLRGKPVFPSTVQVCQEQNRVLSAKNKDKPASDSFKHCLSQMKALLKSRPENNGFARAGEWVEAGISGCAIG